MPPRGPRRGPPSGGLMEGYLLAQSFSSAPDRYNRMRPMPLAVAIISQFDEPLEFPLEVSVEHVTTPTQRPPLHRAGLFDQPRGPATVSARFNGLDASVMKQQATNDPAKSSADLLRASRGGVERQS
jgi:hypothetical protein